MMGLEGQNEDEANDLNQHEVEVPVLILQQILIVPILSHHRELGLRLDLLGVHLDLPQHRPDAADFALSCCHVLFTTKNALS